MNSITEQKMREFVASLVCSITSFPGRVWRHGSRGDVQKIM